RRTWRRSTARGGTTRSATQTTPQASGFIQEAGPPRISAAALLALAQWCRVRRGASLGGPSCPLPTAAQSPPAPSAHDTSRPADPTVVGPVPGEASGSPDGAQPADRPEPPARSAEGGRP